MIRALRTPAALSTSLIAVACCAALLAGCGAKKDAAASQTAAKVNKEEITVHQINFLLQQQRGLKPEQAEAAGRQILERLIDQEVALQKAQDDKLDRDPRVVQQIEAARRDIISRAYAERLGEGASKPTSGEVHKYYEEKPALFKERKVYNLQELQIEAKPDQIEGLRAALTQAKTINEFTDFLKAKGFRASGGQAVKPAEQLPLAMLDTLAKMGDGQAVLSPTPTGAQVVIVANSRLEPVDEARATPAIEQFLLNDSKRRLVEAGIKQLRSEAKIEYVGKYAAAAASAPSAAPVTAPDPAPATQPSVGAASTASAPAAPRGLNADDISKGMGLKK